LRRALRRCSSLSRFDSMSNPLRHHPDSGSDGDEKVAWFKPTGRGRRNARPVLVLIEIEHWNIRVRPGLTHRDDATISKTRGNVHEVSAGQATELVEERLSFSPAGELTSGNCSMKASRSSMLTGPLLSIKLKSTLQLPRSMRRGTKSETMRLRKQCVYRV